MPCANHPEIQEAVRCCSCGRFFCEKCLITSKGLKFCDACKVLTLSEKEIALQELGACRHADSAMTYAIVSLFFLGFITGPLAIMKAMEAKRQIRLNPALTGSEKASHAIAIGCVGIVLWLALGAWKVFSALSTLGPRHVGS